MKHKINNTRFGFTLIEAIIGAGLMIVAFVGIFGVFRMSMRLVDRSKAKVGALAIANERMELIHNLPYDDIGTLGGIPAGNIPQTENIVLNDINYTRRTLIQYVDDLKDGLGAADENGITADYKMIKVEVIWNANYSVSPVFLVSAITPKGMETISGGGTLVINVFNAAGVPVSSANVHIENSSTIPPISIDVSTNIDGKVFFPGSPSSSGYEIIVSKAGYSASQTYDAVSPNVTPDPGHLSVLEGQTTEASFAIDLVSEKTIKTWEPIKEFSWEDPFNDITKISESDNIAVVGGIVELEEEAPLVYKPTGYLMSRDIGGISSLQNWNQFSWNDSKLANTSIKYQIYYENEFFNLVPIPDADLPGNEVGFENSPVDLSGLNTGTYKTLRLKAVLSTSDTSVTPQIEDWKITWNAGPYPLANIAFNMKGQKIIGHNAAGDPIYKYSQNLSTGAGGNILLSNLEWDAYNITVNSPIIGYDVSEICPFQPFGIAPNTSNTTDMYLVAHSANTLLVAVKNSAGVMLDNVSTRLYKAGYDQTQITSSCGQTFFTPLSSSDYTVEISKAGYVTASTSPVSVAGQSRLELILNEI